MKKNIVFLYVIFLYGFNGIYCPAQEFMWRSEIPAVLTDEFYKIQLKPEIISKLNDEFGDIRIYDPENKEVPYLFQSESALSFKDFFVEYEIIERKEQISWPYYTRIVIHNPAKNNISNIHLVIRNSDVSKSLKLSGSDNNKDWYVIKDNYRFQALYSDFETSVIKIIDFPISNYEFYEILIDDWKNNPLKVISAGYYNTSIEKGIYSPIMTPTISQYEIKNEKESLIKLHYDEKQLINKIALKIEGPEFYYRNVRIQVEDSVLNKRNKYEKKINTIAEIIISSNSENIYYFESLRTKELFIKISNQDNLPLKIKSVESYQLNHYLVCKLYSGKGYGILFGNPAVSVPDYDIKYFSEKIPEQLKIIKNLEVTSTGKSKTNKPFGLILEKKYVWIAIVLVVALLLFTISRMLKDMKHKQDDSR